MKALCRSALQGAGVHFFVYIDDILLAGTCVPALRRALGLLVRKLEGCGFIISEKSVRVPTRRVKFVGKVLDGRRRCIYNGCQLSACILARLVSAVGEGGVERRKFEALLGKMLWFLRPLQGVGPFLAGAYRAVRGGGGQGVYDGEPDQVAGNSFRFGARERLCRAKGWGAEALGGLVQ